MRQFKVGIHRGPAIVRLRRHLLAALTAHLQGGPPRPPVAGVALWQAFCALSDGRQWRDGLPDAIQPSEVLAWARLHGRHIPPHHAGILAAMDAAWLAWAQTPEAERVAGPLTGAMFDAMLGG
jgi:hypothetical protein